ncbi:MAG: N-acyl-D-amino-acid deacylase [Gammaproteobacteria bacterium]|jgi:N-acyl-D-amino-acid deacylase
MPVCDFIITGARLIDGTGGSSSFQDIAVDRDRIVEIGDCRHWTADQTIDANGLVLAPGFIDSHTHDDHAVLDSDSFICKLSQGVTSIVAGNCGIGIAPLNPNIELPAPFPILADKDAFRYASVSQYREEITRSGTRLNLAFLTGHSNLRLNAMKSGWDRKSTEEEQKAMAEQLRQSLQEGCIGLSSGLDYPPAEKSTTDELMTIAKVLKDFDQAVYVTHMRSESDHIMEAIEETLQIGQSSRSSVIISHHKCAGPKNYGKSAMTLGRIDQAIESGQNVSFDVYPYIASSTSLLASYVDESESILVVESEPFPEFNGQYLHQIAEAWKMDQKECCERLYPATAIYFSMHKSDLNRILSHPAGMIGSDGIASMRKPHPRLWGTFPKVLGYYVREQRLMALETAVHKMTGLTAKNFGLKDRGILKPGNFADLVLFDPETIIDRASFDDPCQLCVGIKQVWINGKSSWNKSKIEGSANGLFLHH